MRRIRYAVATSLDGFIAGPNGETDWIIMDPNIDFNEIFQQFDTVVVGRVTFEPMAAAGRATMPGMKTIVFSKSLKPACYPEVTVVGNEGVTVLRDLCEKPGKDIWLFGGGSLFLSLLNAGLVDTVEAAVMPVILGSGTPLMPPASGQVRLHLAKEKVHKTGVVSLEYTIDNQSKL